MSTYYSQASGAWSLMSNWNTAANGSGSTPANLAAFDNNSVVIQAPHAIMCDVDTSGFSNGLTGLTINGGATPGMLYANTGGNGYILLKAGAVLAGTTSTNRGRLLANSDGVWGHTTPLPFGYKFYINELTTAKIDTSNLDSSIWDTEPGITQIATYKTNNTVTASSATSQFTLGVTLASLGWANNTPIMFTGANLPTATLGGIAANITTSNVYYLVSASGSAFSVALVSGGVALTLTSNGSGTITAYDGHSNTSTGTMNVFTDVTGDPQWLSGADVVLVNVNNTGNAAYQLTTISGAPTSSTLTLAVNVAASQYPGATIYLVQRNVRISNNNTANSNIIDFVSSTFTGSVFQCEIIQTSGQKGYGISGGTGHTATTIAGCGAGLYVGTGNTATTIVGCSNGISGGTGNTATTIVGCVNGFNGGTGNTATTIVGCGNGISGGTGNTATTITGCTFGISSGTGNTATTIAGCGSGLYGGTGNILLGNAAGNTTTVAFVADALLSVQFQPSSTFPNPPTFSGRNPAGDGNSNSVLLCPGYGNDLTQSRAFYIFGDVIRDNVNVRSGGAPSAIQVVPQSNCGATKVNYVPIFTWTELAATAASLTRTVYMKGSGWSTFPTAAQLYIEAEYVSNATTLVTTKVASTAVLVDNTNWVAFSVTFAPAAVGPVTYRAYLKTYASGAKVYADNQLSGMNAQWSGGVSQLVSKMLPAESNVYSGVDRGDGNTGTLHASNIATAAGSGENVTTANLLSGHTVDDVTGAASGGTTIFVIED